MIHGRTGCVHCQKISLLEDRPFFRIVLVSESVDQNLIAVGIGGVIGCPIDIEIHIHPRERWRPLRSVRLDRGPCMSVVEYAIEADNVGVVGFNAF